jgi:ubiquinone/menaquinone biosynthesis C-methylase UbiE
MNFNFLKNIKKEIRYARLKKWGLQEVGKHWDDTTHYDDINEKTYSYFRRFIDGYNLFKPFLNSEKHAKVLDICSRTGNGSKYYYEKIKNPNWKFVCADVTDRMMNIADEVLSEAKINHSMIKLENLNLPLSDNEFDYILFYETLEHVDNPEKLISELARVLKPGGYILLTTPNVLWALAHQLAPILGLHHSEGPHHMVSKKRILNSFKKNNLKIVAQDTNVILPFGPKKITNLIGKLENRWLKFLKPLGLRRMFVVKK